jgi:hypothetical protein
MMILAGALLAMPAAVPAFEGTVKLRTMSVPREIMGKLAGGVGADKALQVTPEQVLAAKDAGAKVHEGVVYVSGTKVRMDLPSERGPGGYAIIDTAQDMTWFVMPAEKKYIEWSEADAKVMADKVADVEKMMKERMASLPPEQRKQVEAMMKNLKKPSADPPVAKINLVDLDRERTVNGMEAEGFQVKAGDNVLVGWITEDHPGLAEALRTVQKRMQKMTPANLRGGETARAAFLDKGLPVMVQSVDPKNYRIEEIVSVAPGAIDAALFALPADYAKTTGREALKAVPDSK